MNIILILACFAAFYNIKIIGYNKDYLSVRQTENLKGIFIVRVLFHHLNIFAGVGDVYNIFMNAGYIAVGGFLFISGYGLMYQFANKGSEYVKNFPKKRILTVIMPALFMSAVYFAMKWKMYGYSLGDMKYDFFRGASVISNGWYVTAIIYFYIAFYISAIFTLVTKKKWLILVLNAGTTIVYIIGCLKINYEGHWFPAAFAFYYGIVWAFYKNKIDNDLKKGIFAVIIGLVAFYYFITMGVQFEYGWAEFKCLMYLTIIILLGMKVKLQSEIMEWLGSMSYEIYLVHGLFFPLLCNNHINFTDKFAFMLTMLILTFISAFILHRLFSNVLKMVLKS